MRYQQPDRCVSKPVLLASMEIFLPVLSSSDSKLVYNSKSGKFRMNLAPFPKKIYPCRIIKDRLAKRKKLTVVRLVLGESSIFPFLLDLSHQGVMGFLAPLPSMGVLVCSYFAKNEDVRNCAFPTTEARNKIPRSGDTDKNHRIKLYVDLK